MNSLEEIFISFAISTKVRGHMQTMRDISTKEVGRTSQVVSSFVGKKCGQVYLVRAAGFFLGLVIVTCGLLRAQIGGSGSINGTVTDPTGAVVPGATVTATNTSTNATTTQVTSNAGTYVLSPLTPGDYSVTITVDGFKRFTQEHISVNALQPVGLKSELVLGSSNEIVTVVGAPPQLETTNATIGITMENEDYTQLPLQINGGPRNPTAFVYLTPGVAHGGPGVQTGIFNGSGSQGRVDEVYIDGFPQTSIYEQGDPRYVSNLVSVEAVDQFQVVTSNPSAQYQGIGLENYVVKSGTNQIHGSVFEYLRTTALDTWGFYAPAVINPTIGKAVKPQEHQSEYGVTLGMPIKKNKIFFFGTYDGFLYHKDNNPTFTTYPTMRMRTGDFSELLALSTPQPIYDPLSCPTGSQGSGSCTRTQFNYGGHPNVINPSRLGAAEQFMMKFLPTPINGNVTNNYLSQIPSFTHHWDTTERLDWKINEKQNFSFVFGAELGGVYGYQSNGSNPGPLPYTSGQGYETKNKLFMLEHTYTITPHVVNQLKYGYSRFWGPVFNPDYRNKGFGMGTDGGITGLPAGQASASFATVTWAGNNALTQWSGDQDYNAMTNYYTLLDNVQWTHGRHNMTFGAVHEWLQLNDYTFTTGTSPLMLGYSNAQTALYTGGTQSTTTGNALASFFIGQTNTGSLTQLPFTDTGARIGNTSVYGQDDFQLSPKLVLNVGLRWDYYPVYTEVQNRSSFFIPTLTNPITGNLGALQFAGNGSSPTYCNCSTPVNPWHKNFGPRIGLAYSVTPRTVIRGGYSITYSHGTGARNATYLGTGTTGFSAAPNFTSTTAGDQAFNLNGGFPAYAAPPTISNGYGTFFTTASTAPAASMSYADPYLGDRQPYANNYNFGIEQQLTNDLAFQLNYVGSQGHFLPVNNSGARGVWSNQLNPAYYNLGGLLSSTVTPATLAAAQAINPSIKLPYPTFSGTLAQMLLPFPQYSGLNDTYDNIVNSNYNALQLVVRQRMSHGLQFMFNYTWGAAIDDDGTFRSGYLSNRIERSRSTVDSPNVVNATAIYKLPFGRGHDLGANNVVVRSLVSDWQLSGIYTYASGVPLAIIATGCNTPGGGQCMPNYNTAFTGPARINGKWGSGATAALSPSYINLSAFSNPPAYTFGNLARTAAYGLRGPVNFDLDMSLKKTIPIHESINALIDVSAYNVTNSVIFGAPPINTGTPSTFGKVTSQANNSRDIQLAFRLNF
jgi:hypothetical protein